MNKFMNLMRILLLVACSLGIIDGIMTLLRIAGVVTFGVVDPTMMAIGSIFVNIGLVGYILLRK